MRSPLDTALLEAIDHEGRWVDLPDGRQVKVTVAYDQDCNPFREYDYLGRVQWVHARDSRDTRPKGFDGAARKIWGRSDCYWWQPPSDVVSTPEVLEAVYRRARGYLQDDWHYVSIGIDVLSVPCAHCGERKETLAGCLGGVESDSGVDYFLEVVGELLSEVSA